MDEFISSLLSYLIKDLDYKNSLIIFSLIMARMVTITSLVPFLGARNAPNTAKLAIAVSLSFLVWPVVIQNMHGPPPADGPTFILMMFKEILVGFTIGFITSEIFYTVTISGQLIDMFRGANQIQAMVPELKQRSSAFGTLAFQLLLALFLAAGFHELFFEAIIDSFKYIPVNAWPKFSHGVEPLANEVMFLMARIFRIALTLATPVAIICLLISLTFGLMNRIAPQINAFFMSLPAKTLGGIMIFFAAFSMTVEQYRHYSGEVIKKLLDFIQLLR